MKGWTGCWTLRRERRFATFSEASWTSSARRVLPPPASAGSSSFFLHLPALLFHAADHFIDVIASAHLQRDLDLNVPDGALGESAIVVNLHHVGAALSYRGDERRQRPRAIRKPHHQAH